MLAVMCEAYQEEQLENDSRVVLKLHPALAPYKVAVLPLSKNYPIKGMKYSQNYQNTLA